MIKEAEPLRDLRHDVLHNQAAAGIEFELAQVSEQLRGRGAEQSREGERRLLAEVKFDGASDPVDPGAMALGARGAGVGDIFRRVDAERAEPRERIVVVALGLQHPGENPAVAATGGTPAARRVEREILGIELGEGLTGLDVGARGREPGQDVAAFGDEEAGAFPHLQRAVEGGVGGGRGFSFGLGRGGRGAFSGFGPGRQTRL